MPESRFNFKPDNSGSPKAPSFGSSQGNALEMFIAKSIIDQQNQSKRTKGIGEVMGQVTEQFPNGTPVGSNLNIGENTSVSVPLNRELNDAETRSVAANELYPGIKDEAIGLVKKGVLNSKDGFLGMGSFKDQDRTVRQVAAQQKSPLATYYDPDLQNLQSKLMKLKELMFERGGTALTPTEEHILGNAFVLEGKSDDQILEDISFADKLVETKARLALGGANAAKVGAVNEVPDDSGFSQEPEQDKKALLEAIKQRYKQRNP
jgi:hypothetical protein